MRVCVCVCVCVCVQELMNHIILKKKKDMLRCLYTQSSTVCMYVCNRTTTRTQSNRCSTSSMYQHKEQTVLHLPESSEQEGEESPEEREVRQQ